MARKRVRLVHLKLVDFIRTNDELVFVYKGRTFSATMTRDGYIATRYHAAHRHANRTHDGLSMYVLPSNFTNDCVRAYFADTPTETPSRTNPSGYERVRHVRTNKTLNELRDAYIDEFGGVDDDSSASAPTDDIAVDVPSDVMAQVHDRAAARSPAASSTAASLGDRVGAVLSDGAVTIAAIRASMNETTPGYKAIAQLLERKLHAHRTALVDVVGMVRGTPVRVATRTAPVSRVHKRAAAPARASVPATVLHAASNLDAHLAATHHGLWAPRFYGD